MNIIFGSGGNDSVALYQWAVENKLKNLTVAYSNTGWAADFWAERLKQYEDYIVKTSGKYVEIQSEGMVALVTRKKAWPRNGMAFCSYELKIKPASEWLEQYDPAKEATCLVGIRREESAKRSQWPEWVEESENHGGRSLHAPMVRFSEQERNALIFRAGFEVLPHRSMECYPRVNASKSDIKMLDITRIDYIEQIETGLGVGVVSGKKKTMFRPATKKGATGIRDVWQWSQTSNFVAGQNDMFCDSGFCGG